MSSKPKTNPNTQSQATSTHAGESSGGRLAREEEIRRRAYELYLERGEQPGRELDDWLQAERELARLALAQARSFTASCFCHDAQCALGDGQKMKESLRYQSLIALSNAAVHSLWAMG